MCINLSFNTISQVLNGTNIIFQLNLNYLDFSSHKLDLVSHYAFHEPSPLEALDLGENKQHFTLAGIILKLSFISLFFKTLKATKQDLRGCTSSVCTSIRKWQEDRIMVGTLTFFFLEVACVCLPEGLQTNAHSMGRKVVRGLCVVAGLQHHQDCKDVEGQLIQLECCELGYRVLGKDSPGW